MLTSTKGKALDLSGAFAFLLFTALFASYGLALFAFSTFLGALSFVFSWLAWREMDGDDFNQYGDETAYRACRSVCIILAVASAAVFVAAVIAWVLA